MSEEVYKPTTESGKSAICRGTMEPAEVHPELYRPRAVSFNLPSTHNEEKEKAADNKVPTVQHLSNGDYAINFEEVLITRKDGSKVLITESKATYLPRVERSDRHFLFLKIFALVSTIMFFPTGLPSLILAFHIQTDYKHTQKHGDPDGKSARAVRRTEWLITVSIACGLLLWGIILIIIMQTLSKTSMEEILQSP